MLSEFSEAMQTTKASFSMSGITFATSLAAFVDIIPVFVSIAALVLAILTYLSRRRRGKRDEARAQELHDLKVELKKKELNE